MMRLWRDWRCNLLNRHRVTLATGGVLAYRCVDCHIPIRILGVVCCAGTNRKVRA